MLRKLTFALVLLALPAIAAAESTEKNVEKLKSFYTEIANAGHFEKFNDLVAENLVEHEQLPPGIPATRDGVKQWFTIMRTTFPDLKCDVEFTVAEGDKVAAYLTMSGTQAAEFLGIPSQGHAFSVKVVDIVRFEKGKAVEHWGAMDSGMMMQQLTGEGAKAK